MTKRYTMFEWSPCIPITDKDNETQIEEDEISSKIKTSTMMTSLKKEKSKKALKKRHMKIIAHKTVRIFQVTTSSKIKTKTTKKTPPLKMMVLKKYLR